MSFVYRYRFGVLALTVVGFVLLWDAYSAIVNNPSSLASPSDTLHWFYLLTYNPGVHGILVSGLQLTLTAIFEGFAIAAVIGIPIGFLMGRYVIVDYFLDPWVNAWYSIPAIAFVPLVMNWFGQSYTATMLVAFLIATFSIMINVYTGVKNVSASLVEPGLSYGANGTQMMSKIILPASLPDIMVGLRLGISRAIDGVIIAEMIFTVGGFGGIIFDAADKLELGLAVACLIILAIISIILNETMKYITRRVVAWKESAAMSR
jgi:ABC-type nitrate/sulfonate/bicarbonate transport system permease component